MFINLLLLYCLWNKNFPGDELSFSHSDNMDICNQDGYKSPALSKIMIIVSHLQMLIPKKCPGAPEKPKVAPASDPSPAQPKPETETMLR